jgi:alkanesulfonate monooxygenase SsuD/methylene tetrahydromethanopterin reductase-like flavin-dependent oxidoreductase (luciferase family)
MRIGFAAPTSGSWATPAIMKEVCGRADELGYPSLWTFQRLLYPTGTFLGETYHSVLDPLVSLAYLAACTKRTKLGVAIVNFPFVSPIMMAKQAAAIDVLSEGRLLLGLGMGWAAEEFEASGTTTERRGPRLEEYVGCAQLRGAASSGAAAPAADPARRGRAGSAEAGRSDLRRLDQQ